MCVHFVQTANLTFLKKFEYIRLFKTLSVSLILSLSFTIALSIFLSVCLYVSLYIYMYPSLSLSHTHMLVDKSTKKFYVTRKI